MKIIFLVICFLMLLSFGCQDREGMTGNRSFLSAGQLEGHFNKQETKTKVQTHYS